jgi:hypothetical protein
MYTGLFYKNVLVTIFFQKVIHIFLHILPESVYTITITSAAALCPFQKSLWLLVQPSLHKMFNFIASFTSSCYSLLSGPNG